MASGVQSWSQTAADNATADSNVNAAEGMAPSAVNDSMRAMMASTAKYRDDTAGTLTTGGTSTAYTISSNQTFASLSELDGNELTVKFNATNGASPTLAVDGLTAKAIHSVTGTAIPTGAILANSIHRLTYDNSNNCFVLNSWQPILQITSLTEETAPAVADEVPLYDASATANRKMTLANIFKAVTSLTAETAPATDDELLLYDTSGTSADKITILNLLKVLNSLTEDTSPDESADFLLSYDTSASTVKKVKPSSIVTSQMASAWAFVTVSGGTPTITSAFNMGSVTDNGTGDYTVGFTNNLASANFAAVATVDTVTAAPAIAIITAKSTNAVRVEVRRLSDNSQEDGSFNVVVFATAS